jgi:hypothetical protein
MISRSRRGSHDWIWQTPRSFKITILDIPQMTSRPRRGSHDWVWQTPWSFEITVLESNMKHKVQTKILDKFKLKTNECALLAQEAHTSSKFHHELNIWQRISLLKVRLPKTRLTQQVANDVSIKIKTLIQVVNKSN